MAHLGMTLQKQGTLEARLAEFGLGQSRVADGSYGRQEAWLCSVWLATLDSKKMLRHQRNSCFCLLATFIQPDTDSKGFPCLQPPFLLTLKVQLCAFYCFPGLTFTWIHPCAVLLRDGPVSPQSGNRIFLLVFKGKSFRVERFRVPFQTLPLLQP